jgi:hypothetical protein
MEAITYIHNPCGVHLTTAGDLQFDVLTFDILGFDIETLRQRIREQGCLAKKPLQIYQQLAAVTCNTIASFLHVGRYVVQGEVCSTG